MLPLNNTKLLDKSPEQINGTGGRFDPVYVPAKKAGAMPKVQFQNGARSSATISLSVGGSDASINGMSLAGAVEYLRGQVAEDSEGQANADASQGPALEPDVQTQGRRWTKLLIMFLMRLVQKS